MNLKLKFTGERMIPEYNQGFTFYYEHLLRYLFASQFVKNKRVLDAACGSGYGSKILSDFGVEQLVGIDIDQESINYAQKKYKNSKIVFLQHDLTKSLPFKKKFDVITAFEIVEHLQNHNYLLNSLKSKLKKSGVLLISTPNTKTYANKDNPFHVKELTYKQFKELLEKKFNFVKLFNQSFLFSNTLTPLNSQLSPIKILSETLISSKTSTYSPIVKQDESRYLVAICSDKEINFNIPALNTYKVDDFSLVDGVEGMYSSFRQKIDELEKEIHILKSSKIFLIWKKYTNFKLGVMDLFRKSL